MNRIGQSRSGVDTPVRVLDGRERLARLRVRLLVRVQPQREMQVAPPHDRWGAGDAGSGKALRLPSTCAIRSSTAFRRRIRHPLPMRPVQAPPPPSPRRRRRRRLAPALSKSVRWCRLAAGGLGLVLIRCSIPLAVPPRPLSALALAAAAALSVLALAAASRSCAASCLACASARCCFHRLRSCSLSLGLRLGGCLPGCAPPLALPASAAVPPQAAAKDGSRRPGTPCTRGRRHARRCYRRPPLAALRPCSQMLLPRILAIGAPPPMLADAAAASLHWLRSACARR